MKFLVFSFFIFLVFSFSLSTKRTQIFPESLLTLKNFCFSLTFPGPRQPWREFFCQCSWACRFPIWRKALRTSLWAYLTINYVEKFNYLCAFEAIIISLVKIKFCTYYQLYRQLVLLDHRFMRKYTLYNWRKVLALVFVTQQSHTLLEISWIKGEHFMKISCWHVSKIPKLW